MNNNESKSTVGRRIKIIDELNAKGEVNVKKLSKMFGVSEVTIRNDLGQLEKKHMLIRARGGAMKAAQNFVGVDFPLSDKQKTRLKEKKAIGKKASGLVENGNTIIIDSGTTTFEVAKNLDKVENVTVITSALNVAVHLAEYKNLNVIVPGGSLRHNSLSLIGILAEKGFRDYFCDKLFLGVDSFDIEHGISTPNLEEAHLNQIMIEISKEVIVVADSSKFKRRGFALIAPVTQINTLITDEGIPSDDRTRLEQLGIKVIIVKGG
ncbi:MAG: DeoR family transcriptional regulator [Cyclobacteriaceae bacterium]|nr:MAG: DeoR family transcriptional regulator [Cyclobacteriaceae bacterium]